MCRVGVQVCMLGWVFMYPCYGGRSCMCVRMGVLVGELGGRSCMCVRVGVHVCVRVGVHVCVLGWVFMYVC